MKRIEKDFTTIMKMIDHCNDIIKDTGKEITIDIIDNRSFDDVKEYIKFYADAPNGEKNKLFTFSCNLFQLESAILRFIVHGYYIRSAWYHCKTYTGELIENRRITNLQYYFDTVLNMSSGEIERYKKQSCKL